MQNERKQPARTRWYLDNCAAGSGSNQNWIQLQHARSCRKPARRLCSGALRAAATHLRTERHGGGPGTQSSGLGRSLSPGGQLTSLQWNSACCPYPQASGLQTLRVVLPLVWKHQSIPSPLLVPPIRPAWRLGFWVYETKGS